MLKKDNKLWVWERGLTIFGMLLLRTGLSILRTGADEYLSLDVARFNNLG